MKTELRECEKCKHETIQVAKEVWDRNYQVTCIHGEWVWYCPNCGTHWRVINKRIDEEVII